MPDQENSRKSLVLSPCPGHVRGEPQAALSGSLEAPPVLRLIRPEEPPQEKMEVACTSCRELVGKWTAEQICTSVSMCCQRPVRLLTPVDMGQLHYQPGEGGGFSLIKDGEVTAQGKHLADLVMNMHAHRPRLQGVPVRASLIVVKRKLLQTVFEYQNSGESLSQFIAAAVHAEIARRKAADTGEAETGAEERIEEVRQEALTGLREEEEISEEWRRLSTVQEVGHA